MARGLVLGGPWLFSGYQPDRLAAHAGTAAEAPLMSAPRPDFRFWRGVTIAAALSLPLWAGILYAIRQVLP